MNLKRWTGGLPKPSAIPGGSFDDHEHPAAIIVWDVATGKVKTKLVGHEMTILALAISPDGQRLVSGGFDRTVRM